MKEDALLFHQKFKFNITKIFKEKNQYNVGRNVHKHPGHEWKHFSFLRQGRKALADSSWENVTGIGTVLEFNNLRALDIDDCNSDNFVKWLINKLKLPENYEWTVKSGSANGYHILFYAENNTLNNNESLKIAYCSNKHYKNIFKKIEFRWKSHLVLPPSLHESGNRYEFLYSFPKSPPIFVEMSRIISIIEESCVNNFQLKDEKNSSSSSSEDRDINSSENKYSNSSEDDDSSSSEDDDYSLSEDDDSSSSEDDDSSLSEDDDSSLSEDDDSSLSEDDDSNSSENKYSNSSEDDDSNSSEDDDSNSSEDDDSSSSASESIKKEKYYLFFDTETTGLPVNWKAPVGDLANWPRVVQIAWILSDSNGNIKNKGSHIIRPRGFSIPDDSTQIHGITNMIAILKGKPIEDILYEFLILIKKADYIIAHNISFDEKVIGAEFIRKTNQNPLNNKFKICTMESSTNY